jgi:hypothetical protein
MKKKNETTLNGTVTLGSDAERKELTSFIGRIRELRQEREGKTFALLEECKRFDDSGLWQLYGTWTFARVLQEECGVKVSDYDVYKAAIDHVAPDVARAMGLAALREIRRVLRQVDADSKQDVAATLTTVVARKIDACRAEHGFAPTSKGAVAMVRVEADRLGLATKGATEDGLRKRYQWLIGTLEQIESLSDDGSAVGVLARNALTRVGRPSADSTTARKGGRKAA